MFSRNGFLSTVMLTCVLFTGSIAAASETYTLQNDYIRVSGSDGYISELQFDPAGKRQYGKNWIRSIQMGDTPLSSGAALRWNHTDDGVLRIANAAVALPQKRGLEGKREAAPLWAGSRLGQRFRSDWDGLTRVGGVFPTWCSNDSGFLLTLRQESPEGEILAQRRFQNIPDALEQHIELEAPLPKGFYYLEMSEPVGSPGWYFQPFEDVHYEKRDEIGFMTGPIGDIKVPQNYDLRAYGYNIAHADWELKLADHRLSWKVLTTTAPAVQLVTPWIRDGYVTDDPDHIVFSRFVCDAGLYRPVHQFKRRSSEWLHVPTWMDMTGTSGFNVRFVFGGRIDWAMTRDSMAYQFPAGTEITLEAQPFTDKLSDQFPEFFSSDQEMDSLLNQFLWGHGLNFGTGTLPDWKEWLSRILAWTKNPQKDAEASYLAGGYQMTDDGYVYTWGGSIGWPFPFADEDGDGKNDYDTRHFTTNPCFILGIANHALWSRDKAFLEAALPRARRAMEFQLKELSGEDGIVIITAPGHEGRPNGIGSNYWDILPFGHKDAFTNSYYYASLEAMAKLEELGKALGVGDDTPGRSPEEYRELRKKVREQYRQTFWNDRDGRFAGCVDVDGVVRDYGFTFVNTEAAAYGLPEEEEGRRIFDWLDNGVSASGEKDIYSRWIFAPRSSTIFYPTHSSYNLKPGLPETDMPGWWHFGWHGTRYDDQCQAGGAILYTSYYDIMGRARYLGADNAFARFRAILDRYAEPDRLSGGSPLYRGETSQGPNAGSVGVESEFPESGLVPSSFLYAFIGAEPDAKGLVITPNLPKELEFAGVRNLSFGGKTYELHVTKTSVRATCTDPGSSLIKEWTIAPGESVRLEP